MIEENIGSNRDTGLGEDFLNGTPLTKPLRLDHTHMHMYIHVRTYISKKVVTWADKGPHKYFNSNNNNNNKRKILSNRQASMSNLLSMVGNGSPGDSPNNVVSM